MGTKARRVDAAYQDLRAVLDKKVTHRNTHLHGDTCIVCNTEFYFLQEQRG